MREDRLSSERARERLAEKAPELLSVVTDLVMAEIDEDSGLDTLASLVHYVALGLPVREGASLRDPVCPFCHSARAYHERKRCRR